jgi:uroporphyrinogen decarboxylase
MTSRERLTKVLVREIPDCVPVAPDISNMIPAKLTGKPYWELYLYKDPPIYMAYLNAVRKLGFDSFMDGYVPINLGDDEEAGYEEVAVEEREDRIVTMKYDKEKSTVHKKVWLDSATVYHKDNPPSRGLDPETIGIGKTPKGYKKIEGIKKMPEGAELLSLVKKEMGDMGLVGVFCGTSLLLHNEKEIFEFYDNPRKYYDKRDSLIDRYTQRFHKLMSLSDTPDFICTGGSGSLVFQSPEIFRELALPIVKHLTALCKEHNIPSHIHSCGPETALVKMCAEETDLTVVDPLEIPPMGDSNLAELKKKYGDKLVLKGNLHTTKVMLNGSVQEVIDASKKAIDDAAEGGGFILSTGDQCGRDTPLENLHAMVETARTYGRY